MPLKDMATSTATFVLLRYVFVISHGEDFGLCIFFTDYRTLGGTVGISVGQAIWSSVNDAAYSTVCLY